MSVNQKTLVFVYGTLRQGSSNHFRLGAAPLTGEAWVLGHLYRIDWYPGLRLDEEGVPVRGEDYEIDRELLRELDTFEGSEYERLKATVCVKGGEELYTWLYEYRGQVNSGAELLPADWRHHERCPLHTDSVPFFSLATFILLPAALAWGAHVVWTEGDPNSITGWIGRAGAVLLMVLPFLTGWRAYQQQERWAEGAGLCAGVAFIAFWLLLFIGFFPAAFEAFPN